MKQRLLIVLTLLAFVLAGTASAVKRVPKSDDRPSIENQKPDRAGNSSDQKAPSEPPKKQGEADRNNDRRPDNDRRKDEQRPEQQKQPKDDSQQKDRPKDRDKFIDENDDGLNDRYKKPPEKVIRKKESEDSSKKEPSRERRDR